MFCSGCGKKVISAGERCTICGTVTEPLRSFKKLDVDISAVGLSDEQQETSMQQERIIEKEKIIYKVSPKYKKFVSALTVLTVIFIVTTIIFAMNMSIKSRELHELQNYDVMVSEKVYDLSGTVDVKDGQDILVFEEEIVVSFEDEECAINEVYIYSDKDIQKTEEVVKVKGKILRVKTDKYIVIPV